MTDIKTLGPMPRRPRKWVRIIAKHGHHRGCAWHAIDEDDDYRIALHCTCRELDEDDYAAECERRYDAWKNGDYREREEL